MLVTERNSQVKIAMNILIIHVLYSIMQLFAGAAE
jgi:hypothetical protein